ncbi:hypothetical protein AM345 [Anaplasma marginale str. St. Maries]|nr:hypothetical protein AM345 [Anaplasma marginale str. St. Maries]
MLVTWDVAIYAHWNISWRSIDIQLWVTRISNAYSDVCMRYAGRVAQICCLNSQYGARPHFRLPMVCVCAVCIVVLYLPGFSATATTDVWHECTLRNLDVLPVA